MVRFVEMDEQVTISKQMEEDIGPIIFINKFNISPEDVDEFLKRWAADATAFRQQTGFIAFGLIKLHQRQKEILKLEEINDTNF
jgi:quinol monooxygenase YgiN